MTDRESARLGTSGEASVDAGSRGRAPDARQSQGPAKGASEHGDDCSCVRCRGFEPGHELSTRHGAYASVARLGERVAEVAAVFEELVPAYRPSDGPAVQLLALTFARIERAVAAIEAAETAGQVETLTSLRSDLRGWVNTSSRLLNDLAMTPSSRGRLGLDVALAKRAETVTQLAADAARERDEIVEDEATEAS